MTTQTDILPHGVRFAEKWIEWKNYRKALGKPYKTQKGVTMALNQLKAVSESDAIEMMDNSMRQEYQGLFPLKKTQGKTETDVVYREPEQKQLSDYLAKPFDRAEGIRHIRKKLKKNFENGTPIKDYGGVYTCLLIEKCQMLIPGDIKREIAEEVEHEATRERNRFEERYLGSVESDIRDLKLNWFLDRARKEERKLYLEI